VLAVCYQGMMDTSGEQLERDQLWVTDDGYEWRVVGACWLYVTDNGHEWREIGA
jgi:hypothetical protein